MTARDFCYWLQGFFELAPPNTVSNKLVLNPEQIEAIRRHLALVFAHEIDPHAGGPEKQATLNAIHNMGKVKMRC